MMTPDRELDALIAEKVMGWTRIEWRKGSSDFYGGPPNIPHEPQDFDEEDFLAYSETNTYVGHTWESWREVPKYSTSIADAEAVWLWMHNHGRVQIHNGDGDTYEVEFWPFTAAELFEDGSHRLLYYARADAGEAESYPHAICVAALRAVGVEVPE